ncbi:protein-glutamine gamma-glutamyltransferase 2 [Thalassophryne amazonica]|uniref:protein-glutamine gamma-glutamyltransferase 2 n=1 Tax=Thalassophryne amazonica TaxID=390379 RepID=UPI00147258C6|nr:protein-glutamine gamma-glutamyltransferase 2 [Thalassophryne amazonica]
MANHKGVSIAVDLRSHENNSAHRTKEIDREHLIVRRGQPFSITLQLSDNLLPYHSLALVLYLGDNLVITVQDEYGANDKWWFHQQKAQDEVLLSLHSPADAPIGLYQLGVSVMSRDGQIVQETNNLRFHLLFNPWCKDDAVYLPEEILLQEYVLNEDGIIYMGAWDHINSIPWNYGQFEDHVMDICFEILDNSNNARQNLAEDCECRSDPVHVSRIITAMVNSNDDSGVLFGRWTGSYSDGVAPYNWTGSVPILQQWSKSGYRAVRYGQCWVFAAVACTVLRCLGIPTRVITNFCSAHDVDGNLSLDFLFNEKLESLEGSGKSDSSWNFHCWVESWMKRPDLPTGNDGWQVLDPTPQELSDGIFCCGPCPVTAIKEGTLQVKYDTPFVFAEVNADIIYWIVQNDGQRKKIRVDESTVGRNISTKSVYGDHREDVTRHYKYPEGSKQERKVYERAGRRVMPSNRVGPEQLHLKIEHSNPVFGTDFDVIIEVQNRGNKDTCAQLVMVLKAVTYNSLQLDECQRRKTSITVSAHDAHREVLRLYYDEYAHCVSEHNLINVIAFIEASGENEPTLTMSSIPLIMPELDIEVSGKAVVKEQVKVIISFTNPLSVALKGGVFTVEGAGLLSATKAHVHKDIAPGQKVSCRLSFIPTRAGVKKLLVNFDSDKLKDLKGVATVLVHKRRSHTR